MAETSRKGHLEKLFYDEKQGPSQVQEAKKKNGRESI